MSLTNNTQPSQPLSTDVFSSSYVPQTPGGARLQTILPNYKDQGACASKILDFLEQISAKRTASQHAPGKEPKSFSIPVEDFKAILDLARQNKRNIEAGNRIATQLATLTEDIHSRFDKLESDMSALSSNPPSSQPLTYSQVASAGKSASVLSHPTVAPPSAPPSKIRNPELDLTLIQSHPANPVYPTTLFPELKRLVDTAIESAAIVDTNGKPLKVCAVSCHASKDLIITMNSTTDADRLCANPRWVPLFSRELTLRRPVYAIIAHQVPTTFDPSSNDDFEDLQSSNPGILDSLARVMWACPNLDTTKKFSSLVLHLHNPRDANKAIINSISYNGTLLATEKSRRSVLQCHHCQRFGHTAARCSAQKSCGRCAGPHLTTECRCTTSPPCRDHRECEHIAPLCILCKGDHRATSKDCPSRVQALARLNDSSNSDPLLYPVHE